MSSAQEGTPAGPGAGLVPGSATGNGSAAAVKKAAAVNGTIVDSRAADKEAAADGRAAHGARRLVGVDAARGAALLGMIAVHSLSEADAAGRPTVEYTVVSGRAAALFGVLAGVGVAFLTGRRQVAQSARRATVAGLAVRALLICAFGLVLGQLDTVMGAVVLTYLGMALLLVIPLVFRPTWQVALVGLGAAGLAPAINYYLMSHLPAPRLVNPTVGYLLDEPVGLVIELVFTGFYPALPWLTYLCAGLVVGRLALTSARVALALLGIGAGLAAAASTASTVLLVRYEGLARIWAAQPASGWTAEETAYLLTFGGDGTVPVATWWWLALDAPHTSTPVNLLSTTGAALAVLGLLLLAGHATGPLLRRLVSLVRTPLAALGAMTLTLYVGHVLFLNSDYDTFDATGGFLVQVGAALLIGLAWWATGGRGPLEALVSALSGRARRLAGRGSHRRRPSHVIERV